MAKAQRDSDNATAAINLQGTILDAERDRITREFNSVMTTFGSALLSFGQGFASTVNSSTADLSATMVNTLAINDAENKGVGENKGPGRGGSCLPPRPGPSFPCGRRATPPPTRPGPGVTGPFGSPSPLHTTVTVGAKSSRFRHGVGRSCTTLPPTIVLSTLIRRISSSGHVK